MAKEKAKKEHKGKAAEKTEKQEHTHEKKRHAEKTTEHKQEAKVHEEKHSEKKEEKKTEKHAEKKEEKATEKKTEPSKQEEKPAEKKPKKIIEKFVNPKKSIEIKKFRDLIKKRPRRLFRGRFGQRNKIRSIHKEKWQKWRKPRGKDIIHKKEDGFRVKIGFRSSRQIRFRHPSGFKEIIVNNTRELEQAAAQKENAVKIAHRIGKRKRKELLAKAKELKIWVLNP